MHQKLENERITILDFGAKGACWDSLCRMVERFMPEYVETLEKAKLFVFPVRGHGILADSSALEDFVYVNERFRFPFPVIAIEDTASVVVFITIPGAVGMGQKILFFEAQRLGSRTRVSEFKFTGPIARSCDGIEVLNFGELEDLYLTGEGREIAGNFKLIRHLVVENKKTVIADHGRSLEAEFQRSIALNALTALAELIYFHTPEHVCIGITGTSKRQGKRVKGRMTRFQDRTVHTLVAYEDAKKVMGVKEPCRQQPSKSENGKRHISRHRRSYKHERFVNKRGQTDWVGPKEVQVGKRTFKVFDQLASY